MFRNMRRFKQQVSEAYFFVGREVTITSFDLAVNRKGKSSYNSECDFFHCTSFGKTAEFIDRYFVKGSKMILAGKNRK